MLTISVLRIPARIFHVSRKQRGPFRLAIRPLLHCNGGLIARRKSRCGSAGRPLRQDNHVKNTCKRSREALAAFLFREKQNAFFSELSLSFYRRIMYLRIYISYRSKTGHPRDVPTSDMRKNENRQKNTKNIVKNLHFSLIISNFAPAMLKATQRTGCSAVG